MQIDKELEILIITYNRAPKLERTLKTILSDDSPLKKMPILIIDNASTDNTAELCQFYTDKYANVSFQRNRRNAGLSGNICHAFEAASKKYMWILADDDTFDFSAWSEIEKAIKEDYDLILTCRMYISEKETNIPAITATQITFLPSAIYKTSFLTSDVMSYAVLDAYTILPHVCLGYNIINKKGRIFVPSKSIVNIGREEYIDFKKHSHNRVEGEDLLKHSQQSVFNFYYGLAVSLDALKDEKLRLDVFSNMLSSERLNGWPAFITAQFMMYSFLEGRTSLPKVYEVYLRAPQPFQEELHKMFGYFFRYGMHRLKDYQLIPLYITKWKYKVNFWFRKGAACQHYKDLYCAINRVIKYIKKIERRQ